MASNSDPKSQENANATNPSQPMIVTLNQSPQAQPETMQGFQPRSPNQQAFQAQPQMPMQYQQGFQAQSTIQQQQQAYGMQYQQQAQAQSNPTCSCCIPMMNGLIVIAIVGIVIGLPQIGYAIYGFLIENGSSIYHVAAGGFMMLLYVAYIIACILLIVGAITRKEPFFWPYIVVAMDFAFKKHKPEVDLLVSSPEELLEHTEKSRGGLEESSYVLLSPSRAKTRRMRRDTIFERYGGKRVTTLISVPSNLNAIQNDESDENAMNVEQPEDDDRLKQELIEAKLRTIELDEELQSALQNHDAATAQLTKAMSDLKQEMALTLKERNIT